MEEKKLRRSRKNRVFLGVLGGLAEYLNLDPVLVRLLFIVFFVFYPAQASLAYILAAVVIPEEGEGDEKDVREKLNRLASEVEERFRGVGGIDVIGVLLVLIGVLLLGRAFMPVKVSSQTVLAVALIIIGVLLLGGDRK